MASRPIYHFTAQNRAGQSGPRASPGLGPGAQGARREAERAEAEASILAGGLDEQHAAVLEAADVRRRAPAAGAMEPLAMPDGTTMLVKHGSGGRVQARAAGAAPAGAPQSRPAFWQLLLGEILWGTAARMAREGVSAGMPAARAARRACAEGGG